MRSIDKIKNIKISIIQFEFLFHLCISKRNDLSDLGYQGKLLNYVNSSLKKKARCHYRFEIFFFNE